ncbi:Uncharacterised protein (plasmid) [Legionella adelaidensis]|uniref:Uncharacterized protein n=1 Tax=Legionella adelaidensis TaxID=45056 RepID=A0A0W0R445_9GAMM|nr:hypothetical protein [Legionella adelaidensis]KTC65804.1 hypothetical protein Lade_0462 [Legionella adelaidensis]VEH85232.1 Uncharacterised protein [Legionella adelaidensis]
MRITVLIASLCTIALCSPLSHAATSSKQETTATFKTEEGKTIRCIIHPEDVIQFSQVKNGTNVKLSCANGIGCLK